MAYESPKLEIINNNPLEYTSELRSRIFKNGNLEDVIEFFVFYKGKQRVANNEFSDWIDNTLSDILGTNRV
jgi:exoribonuclease II